MIDLINKKISEQEEKKDRIEKKLLDLFKDIHKYFQNTYGLDLRDKDVTINLREPLSMMNQVLGPIKKSLKKLSVDTSKADNELEQCTTRINKRIIKIQELQAHIQDLKNQLSQSAENSHTRMTC